MSSSSWNSRPGSSSSGEANVPGDGGRYVKVCPVGNGTFGEAWLVKSKASGRHYVIKEQKINQATNSEEREKTMNEVQIIRTCSHVNIVRYKDCFITQLSHGQAVLSIVMEYADDGDLHECIKKQREVKKVYFKEGQIRNWLVQIAFALEYLHKRKILHRDVKTHNIFVVKTGLVKLGDFGISKVLSAEDDWASTGIGTPQYLSPEICRKQKYSYKSDIWGLGCVFYEMCALNPAFPQQDWLGLINAICRGSYKPIPPTYSTTLAELVKVMLRPDPARRVSAAQVLTSKVLEEDVLRYMAFIKTLPGGGVDNRKGSSSSVGSAEFASGASGGGGGVGGGGNGTMV